MVASFCSEEAQILKYVKASDILNYLIQFSTKYKFI